MGCDISPKPTLEIMFEDGTHRGRMILYTKQDSRYVRGPLSASCRVLQAPKLCRWLCPGRPLPVDLAMDSASVDRMHDGLGIPGHDA